jgi:hypothetical protein
MQPAVPAPHFHPAQKNPDRHLVFHTRIAVDTITVQSTLIKGDLQVSPHGRFRAAVLYTFQYSTDCYLERNFACCVRLDSQVAFRLLFGYNFIKLSRRRSNLPGDLRRVLSLPSNPLDCWNRVFQCMNLCPNLFLRAIA